MLAPEQENQITTPTSPEPEASARKAHNSQYDVGYGRPPVHTQFKPGTSGNPKGRPVNQTTAKTMVERLINQKVTVRHGQRTREIPMLQAMIHSHAAKGAQGDARSARIVFGLLPNAGIWADQTAETNIDGQHSSAIVVPTGDGRPGNALFGYIDRNLLSNDDLIDLSRLAEVIDLGGDFTALSTNDFERVKKIVNKGRGTDVTPSV
jgi:hypothetical protein